MNTYNYKPHVLFHGYKNFEKHIMLSPNTPLWTTDFYCAYDYMDKDTATSGILAMIINANKLKMLDINDKALMTKIYGNGISIIIEQDNIKSFYFFINNISWAFDAVKQYKPSYARELFASIIESHYDYFDELSHNTLSQIYDLWKKENIKQLSSDIYSANIFVPMAAQHGYNYIIEHESEDSSMFNSNEYMLFSKELLAGNCCKFFDYKK